MKIKVNDLVTRKSYNNDTVFKVINIKDNIYYLKGVEARLYADSEKYDLTPIQNYVEENIGEIINSINSDRGEYFYMPGTILHIDGDSEYLEKCLKFYKEANIKAFGERIEEKNIYLKIEDLLKKYNPNIVIFTGHDAYYKKRGSKEDIKSYKNSEYFIKAVRVARKYEKSHDKLIIIAGACQSFYEALIKNGADFASSPKRVNVHALDPAIIATTICLTERNKEIDLQDLLSKTKYGSDGIGGLICNGIMYVGYPKE